MAKRLIWTESARICRKQILEYWIKRTGNKKYSTKLAKEFNQRIDYLKVYPKIGKQTNFKKIRTTACGHFSIFFLDDWTK